MVAKGAQSTTEPPRKRPRLDPKKPFRKLTSVEDIRAGLRVQTPDALTETLTALRNQLSIRPGEDAISPQDERLLLAQHWMESVPGAHDIFEIWDNTTQRQTSALALIVSVLSSLLSLLSSHYTYHTLGQPILKTLLTPTYTRRLNSYLGGSHSELILTTLKLYNGMSAFAGGRERNAVLDAFGWGIKSLPKILNMRRKTKAEEVVDPLAKPDIRTLYVLLILSFIDTDSSTQTKTTFLEHHRDAFLSVFKGLVQDSYPVARKILEVCWSGVWSDPKIKRTVKIGLFNETTISHIAKLYDRTASEDDEAEQVPADLAHHFLLAICTRPGVGICFKDRGWYPREADGDDRLAKETDDNEPVKRGGKIYNKILSNVLKTLKVNEDVRQQELALKILAACPELVAGYWSGAALTLEPRLSSKWIANIALFGSIISLPTPSESFRLPGPGGTLYQPTPPPLNSIMENILPSVSTKAHFSKGLLSASGLVQHCTALALAKCLDKYQRVLALFGEIEALLGESEADGQWCKRRRDVEREARRRVPEFQVIVAFSQQKFGEAAAGATAVPPNPTKAALLSESAQRLLWMYHRCLPTVVAEARFDVGKLLQNFSADAPTSGANPDSDDADGSPDAAARLNMVRQLHVLRLLKDSDQFVWSGKMGSSSQSYLATLLKAYAVSDHPATRSALAGLLNHVLAESIMFQEDPDEPELWLAALPTSRRAPGTESPDGAPLTDEADSVISFLDDCIQRCMKTPYRYIEELYALTSPDADPQNPNAALADACPSPLLMAALEQLDIKVGKRTLAASDVLALASFMRRLVWRLMTKQQGLRFLRCVLSKLDGMLDTGRLFPQYPVVTGAIRREVSLLRNCFEGPQASPPESGNGSQATRDFLDQVEKLPIPASKQQRALAACEIIDWVRLVEHPLGPSELRRVSDILLAFNPPAIADLAEYADPARGSLWFGLDVPSRFVELRKNLQFDSLFLHSSEAEIGDAASRNILVEVAFGGVPSLLGIRRAVSHVTHRLTIAGAREGLVKGLLLLLASVVERASAVYSAGDVGALKETIFNRSEVIRTYLVSETLADPIQEALHNVVKVSLDPTSRRDQLLLADTTACWLDALKRSLAGEPIKTNLVLIWVPYFQPTDLLGVLDTISKTISPSNSSPLLILETVLHALRSSAEADPSSDLDLDLKKRLPQLLALREAMPDLAVLEEIIAVALASSLPAYCDGRRLVGEPFEETMMDSVVARSKIRWSQHLDRLPDDLPLQSFLDQATWTTSTVEILSTLLYRRLIPKDTFVSWLETGGHARHSIEQLIPVLYAFLDTTSCEGKQIEHPHIDAWTTLVDRLLPVITTENTSLGLMSMSSSCVALILSLAPSFLPTFLTSITKAVKAMPVTSLTTSILNLGHQLHLAFPIEAAPILTALVDHGMQWAVRRFAEESGSFEVVVKELPRLVQIAPDVKPHLAETVISVVIQHHLSNVPALELITSLLTVVQFKPATVNRFLQSIIQHPQIFKLCGSTASGQHSPRDAIINTLYVLFNLHPNNTCQITHVEPLVTLYRGTLSVSDGQILTIFRLFETQRKTSIAPLLGRWSSSPNLPSATSLGAIHSLDAIVVLRTCLSFPSWRRLENSSTEQATAHDAQLYDPIFLILLFSHTLAEHPPESAFAWVELFRTNIVSLLIKALSSKDDGIRDIAFCQIAGLWKCLVNADLQEKPHVTYILTLLKDVYPVPSDEPPKRLPSYTTLILLHALRGIFYPSNFIYPITARFLLQRPELDITDVPMLYNMLYSSTDDWKKERGWMIRFLSDGMMSTEDWRVLKRRHTWDLLSSLFQSSEGDRALRRGIFEILANLTCNAQATTSLILKSGLLSWIEMQLVISKETETIEWIKVLDNIMTIGNSEKFESSTNGEWRNVIGRCLSILLHPDRTSNTPGVFSFVVSALLRLVLLKGPRIMDLSRLLDYGLSHLKQMELTLAIPPEGTKAYTSKVTVPAAPFRSHDIHELYPDEDGLQIWGNAVEALWRITMTFDNKPPVWDALTARLLVWRAIVGAENSSLGEWARKQVVHSMGV